MGAAQASLADIIITPTVQVDMTVAAGTNISKGALLMITDPNTATEQSGSGARFAGIAAADKTTANGDASTTLGVWRDGEWDIWSDEGATITAGDLVSTSGAHALKTATEAEVVTGGVVGKAMESAGGSTIEKIRVRLMA